MGLEDKRERQLEKKHEKQVELAEKAEYLAKLRVMAKNESEQRRSTIRQKEAEVKERQAKHREECTVEAAERIKQKKERYRREEANKRKELQEANVKKQFLQANADMVEAKAHGEQQAGLEREARTRQYNVLMEQKKKNDIAQTDMTVRKENQQREKDAYEEMKASYDMRKKKAIEESDALLKMIKNNSLKAVQLSRTHSQLCKQEFGHTSNRFMTKLQSRQDLTQV